MPEELLKPLFEQYTGQPLAEIQELPSSGSNRRYFRLKGGNLSLIGVLGNNLEENRAFIYLSKHFRDKGLHVPAVLAVSPDELCYVQEDLGDKILFNLVTEGRESRMVDFDLNYFKYCFLKATGLEFNEVLLQEDFEKLKQDLLEDQGNTFMHRDFQARNVLMQEGEPWFIDFQGGRRGPIYYDVASFVWQARSRFPEQLKQKLIQSYLRALRTYQEVDDEQFHARLRLFLLFRTLQVLGAYGCRGPSRIIRT